MEPDSSALLLNGRITVALLTFNCSTRIDVVVTHRMSLGVRVIAVDNGSSDDTVAALRSRAALDVVALPSNIGTAARNEAAKRVTTPYIAFCDDDGWWDRAGLEVACDIMDAHPTVAVVTARILVGETLELDAISAEMSESPLDGDIRIPGVPILGFMAGASIFRTVAFLSSGGYDGRYFMGGEEETLAMPLAMAGWRLQYVPEVVAFHHPSMANAARLRAFAMRNTVIVAWLHRPLRSAMRWTAFTLADTPKNRDYLRGLVMIVKSIPWIVAERHPMDRSLDAQIRRLDQRRFAHRRPLLTRHSCVPEDVVDDP